MRKKTTLAKVTKSTRKSTQNQRSTDVDQKMLQTRISSLSRHTEITKTTFQYTTSVDF